MSPRLLLYSLITLVSLAVIYKKNLSNDSDKNTLQPTKITNHLRYM